MAGPGGTQDVASDATKDPVNPTETMFDLFDADDEAFEETVLEAAPKAEPKADKVASDATAKPKAEPKAEAKTEPAEKPAWLVEQAKGLDIHATVIANLSADDLTKVVIDTLARRPKTEAKEEAKPAPKEEPKPEALPPFDWGKDEDGTQITEKDIPEPYRSLIPTLARKLDRLEKLEAVVKDLHLSRVHSAEKREASAADKVFAKYPAVFGEGTAESIDRQSAAFQRRAQCYVAAKTMYQSVPPEVRKASGMTIESAIETMAKSLFKVASDATEQAEDPKPAAKKKTRPTADDYERGQTAKPTNRTGEPKPAGVGKAKESVAARLREWEAEDEDGSEGETTIDDFFK